MMDGLKTQVLMKVRIANLIVGRWIWRETEIEIEV